MNKKIQNISFMQFTYLAHTCTHKYSYYEDVVSWVFSRQYLKYPHMFMPPTRSYLVSKYLTYIS